MSLLPSYMSELWRCYEQMHREDLQSFDVGLISTDAQDCHESVLSFLAWECGIDISGVSIKIARKMIRAAFDSMQYAGTVSAVVGNIKSIASDARVSEWFEYNGSAYNFKVDIDVVDVGVDEATILKLENIALSKKNVRSVLESITVNLTSIAKCSAAVSTQIGEMATLYPYQLTEIEFHPVANKNLSALQSVETLYIFPKGA